MPQLGVLLNVLLFGGKLYAGIRAESTAVTSDALNSLLDVFSYTAIYVSVKLQEKAPDANHPFGHRRAKPLAGFIIAVFTTILGATLIKEAGFSFLKERSGYMGFPAVQPNSVGTGYANPDSCALTVMGFSIITKFGIGSSYHIAWLRLHSLVLRASFVDSYNDAFASLIAFAGLIMGGFWDNVAALLIGGWILLSDVRVGLKPIGYLMGKIPDDEMMEEIRQATMEVPGATGFNNLRAHFVGDRIHVEVHIEVDSTLPLRAAHDVSMGVRYRLQDFREIDRAFVHIDPITLK